MTDFITDPHFLKHIEARFWRLVDIARIDECWLWAGAKSEKGYGRFYYSGKKYVRAHRFAYFITQGPIPDDLEILHSCDRPLCCNPAHLSANSHQVNMDDMTSRNRTNGPKGCRQHLAKLDEAKVIEIRRLYATGDYSQAALGQLFGISEATARQVVKRITWTHI